MLSVYFIVLLTLQMKVFGAEFYGHFDKKFDIAQVDLVKLAHRSSESREMTLSHANGGGVIETLGGAVTVGHLTPEMINEPLHTSLASARDKITNPDANLAHRSPSTNAKGFWNHFLFRGKSDFRYILPIRNTEVRQEQCRAFPYSQRISHENCETLEIRNNVCFGKCGLAPSSGGDGSSFPCPVCSPVIFGFKTVKLTCIDNTEIIKVVSLIEDCRCETKEGQQSQDNGPVLVQC